MTVVPSLRYLCLKKVISDKVKNYEVLPTVLVRAINLMKDFSGNYFNLSHFHLGRTHYIRIFYDGENWNFKSFMYYLWEWYCSSCREPAAVLDTTIREGQVVPAGSQIQNFFSEVTGNLRLLKFDMRLEVHESQDGTNALVFHTVGKGGTPGVLHLDIAFMFVIFHQITSAMINSYSLV